MKYILTVILSCLVCGLVSAQTNYNIHGSVADTISNVKLHNTSIMVLNAKDSTLRKFTRATADGTFSINNLGKGKFILVASYPKYADYVENFTLDSAHTSHNFGRLSLILKSKLLEGVIVKGTRAAIKIKGDTTEFNASSFTVQPNARVEDLLKQLPGIQVDKDGKITAQGQAVPKVLVDGEEFFGDDPTLVTKNIRADMVDKVQLYDKKSDQATFTGIDDGQKTKTINIKLKEDKKNGYFGKLDAGIGTKKFYQEQLAFNKFWGKKKFSAYGTLANTGKTGLSWEDNSKYGSANNVEMVDGNIYISGGSSDELESFSGQYNGQGIPVARTGGLHFDDKWGGDKYNFNGNYKIGSLGVIGTLNTQNQNNLPSGSSASTNQNYIKSNTDQNFNNYIFRQKLDGMYQIKLDSTANLKITFDATLKNNETRSDNASSSVRGEDVLLNKSDRRIDNKGDQNLFNASGLYTKKLKKLGRTISLNVTESLNQNDTKGNLYQKIDYYKQTGLIDSTKLVDQYKINSIKSNVVSTNFTYSEPFTKYFSVVVNYGFGLNNSTANRQSFAPSTPGAYNRLIDSLSNNYQLNQVSHQLGAIFNYKKEKTIINFGTKVRDVRFQQEDLMSTYSYKRHFLNWNPQASYQYRFSQQRSLYFNYTGSNTQPTIDQVQPIRNNNDDLNIIIGNPDLSPSFTHRFNLNYNSYKVLSDQSFYMGGSYGFTSNPIVNNTFTDSLTGKSRLQYINLGNNTPSNFSLYTSYGRKVKFIGVNIGTNLNANGNTYYNLVNNALNRTRSYNFSAQIRLSKYKQKKYDFYGNFGPTYTTSASSLVTSVNNNGAGFTSYQYINYYFPGKIQFNVEGNYEYRAPTKSFNEKFSRYLINASLIKSFFKDESLKITMTGNDLLNQNTGFSRSANGNSLTQTQYTTIRRYFMLTLTWDFNRMGGGAPQK
jgi:hypothetical protein